MGYISTLVTVLLGIIGILYSKDGKRSPITPIGWVIIILIVISGCLSAIENHRKAKKSAEERSRLAAENARINANMTTLMLASFDLGIPPVRMIFIMDYTWDGKPLEHEDFAGPFPAFGQEGDIGSIWIQVPDITVMKGKVMASDRLGYVDSLDSNSDGDPWFVEDIAPVYAVGAQMNEAIGDNSTRMILSRMTVYHRLGLIILKRPGDNSRVSRALAQLDKVYAYFKFYVPRSADDTDTCTSVIHMPLRFHIWPHDKEYSDKILIEMYRDGESLDIIECESVPF